MEEKTYKVNKCTNLTNSGDRIESSMTTVVRGGVCFEKLYLEKYRDVVGSLAVVTFENVDLSLFRDGLTRSTCRLWRLGYHM